MINLEKRRARNARYMARRRARIALSRATIGRPISAERYIGSPCRRCGCTERYVSSKNCVACQRRRYRGVTPSTYGIPPEFHLWITHAAVPNPSAQ